ncbi:MAG: hypothetical protein LBD48_05800 [Treponema sp.]|jgi:hypothetical protein|nr:hypothetical protein [Treponema sp.]
MAKKPNTIYSPGELDRVRGKLGDIDEQEAKRMAQLLGGEVGYERSEENRDTGKKTNARIKRETVELVVPDRGGRRLSRHVEILDPEEEKEISSKKNPSMGPGRDPLDDPSIQLKISYGERVKMDRYMAQIDFEIKNSFQALVSMFSFFSDPPDYVSPRFITRRMNEYYHTLEQLVTSTRTLFPRNNMKRNEQLKRASPFAYAVLDTIRYWNIEKIDTDLAKIQPHPRAARVSEFAEILRAVYRPLFILEQLNMEEHIKGAFKLLYKILYIENPMEPKEKNQDLIRLALGSFADVRRDVRYGLYPLLMKMISDRWLPYEQIFVARRYRCMSFLGVTEDNQIKAMDLNLQQADSVLEAAKANEAEEAVEELKEETEMAEDSPEAAAQKAKEAAGEAERKALDHGLGALETLFPRAGWERLSEYPDLYPYFAETYGMRRGYELIPPNDPLQQVAVLMHILEDLCVALRYVAFGTIGGSDGNPARVEDYLGGIINSWRGYIDDGFVKEYLPRLTEYCRILENSAESRTSAYAKRVINDIHWTRRLYFLPYYKFESLGPPPFQRQEATPVYSEARTLRKYLAVVAMGIEQGNRQGGAEAKTPCEGIDNPWDQYNFEVPNPVSKRLDALLAPGKRNNAAVIFFALSAATALDNVVNSESSWAYTSPPGTLFRSAGGAGVTPMFGVDNKLDADQIFKDTLKQREAESQPIPE